ncbi:roadblock/LC7 domain-containing protein [Desulfuromonas sp. AOP6]|uniref:roadblock/LC7 domain-containing protein n=1 Tax=Desulfuromonas sp. AOP6 TaxID=1566351 RepID=UPI00126D9C79|nr:roadblock/LC7 domain-containing protein [Desulfuromonas sp. AOP6]BCA78761.1 hypothetical protein AOP6_0548 [Desulfuromonas sp. AOP6]
MANLGDFLEELAGMPRVSGYLLLRDSGQPVAENIGDADKLGAMLQVLLLASRKIQAVLGMARLQHIFVGDADGGRFMVFPLGKFHLGIEPAPGIPGNDLAGEIVDLIRRYQTRSQE